jgi:F-type H+-transporting ATPase subunit delta
VAVNDVAKVYANSIFDIAKEKNILPQIEEELKVVSDILKEEDNFRNYLNSPGIDIDSKKGFVDKVFAGKISEYIVNLLKLLIDNGRQSVVSEIYKAFVELNDIANNRQRITVITQSNLDSSLLDKIKADVGVKFGKEIILTEQVDESILGGIIIKIGDLVIDGSLAKGLKNIRRNLLNSKVRSEMAYED